MGLVEVAVVGLIGFVGLLVLVSIMLVNRVRILEGEQERHWGMLTLQAARVEKLDPSVPATEKPASSRGRSVTRRAKRSGG